MDHDQDGVAWAGLNLREPENDWRCKKCKKCGADIVLLKSKRTGKYYPVNFRDRTDVVVNDFHRCERRVPQSEYDLYKDIGEYLSRNPAPIGGDWDRVISDFGEEKAGVYFKLRKLVNDGITIIPVPDKSKKI